jgi:hypothetical protein
MHAIANPRSNGLLFNSEPVWSPNGSRIVFSSARVAVAAAALLLGATSASGAVVTRTFSINSALLVDWYSSDVFDGPLVGCGVTPTQECSFFGGALPVGRAVTVTNIGTGSGSLNVNYEDTTGEILQVNSMKIRLPNSAIVISAGATITITQGNAIPVVNDAPFVEAGTGTLLRDLDGVGSGTALGKGTADVDQGIAVGQVAIFQHNDAPNLDVPDFANFPEIVDSCVGPFCALFTSGFIPLDAVRYRLEGTISGAGLDALVLKAETASNSIYRVNFTTALEPADLDGDGVSNAVDNCPVTANAAQTNSDVDARGNACDNCIMNSNVTQLDANGDGFGNICDGDINNSGTVTTADFGLLRSVLGQPISFSATAAASDMNGSGTVTTADFGLLRAQLGIPVAGQSGLACAGTVPCPSP